ncbi:MAG: ribonuclease HI [Bacteroidales bacterium]|jgi:ribonuclease HI
MSYRLELYADGACSGNPGPGGWAFVLRDTTISNRTMELSGGVKDTTNNRMELTAVIEGLKVVNSNVSIKVITDSNYVVCGMTEWMPNWLKNNWRTKDKKPVKNVDLWKELLELSKKFTKIDFEWTRGHNGHEYNERCDRLAVEGYQKYLKR